jgi:adenylate cyclase
LVLVLLAVSVLAPGCVSGPSEGGPTHKRFDPIELATLPWYVKRGFRPEDVSGFDTSAPGVLVVTAFPAEPNFLFAVPPSDAVHSYTLQTSFRLETDDPPPLSLTIYFIGENWAIYLNGRPQREEVYLREDGSIRYRRSLLRVRQPIRTQDLRKGDNTLVVRLIGAAPAPTPLLHTHTRIVGKGLTISETAGTRASLFELFLIAFNLVFVCFGLFYVVLYLRNPADRHPLYFSIFCGFFAYYQLSDSFQLIDLSWDMTWIYRLRWLSLAMFGPSMGAFMSSYLYGGRPLSWPLRVMIAISLLFAPWFLAAPYRLANGGVTVWQVFVLGVVAVILHLTARAWRDGRPDARIMTVSMGFLGAAIPVDVYYEFNFGHELHTSQIAILAFVTLLAVLVALRFMELHRRAEGYASRLAAQRDSFARFVPDPLIKLLGKDSESEIQSGDHSFRSMSILFSDIRRFTRLSESLNAQDTFDFINGYMQAMAPCIEAHQGFVDKFLGDGIMALFPDTDARHKPVGERVTSADCAVSAALTMLESLQGLNAARRNVGLPPIRVGIGINSGDVILGTVGSEARLDTTVIGDAVNVAARLEQLTSRIGQVILISENTLRQLTNPRRHHIRKVAAVVLKGKTTLVNVHEIYDRDDEGTRDVKRRNAPALEQAVHLMQRRQYHDATRLLMEVDTGDGTDPVVRYQRSRCERLLGNAGRFLQANGG